MYMCIMYIYIYNMYIYDIYNNIYNIYNDIYIYISISSIGEDWSRLNWTRYQMEPLNKTATLRTWSFNRPYRLPNHTTGTLTIKDEDDSAQELEFGLARMGNWTNKTWTCLRICLSNVRIFKNLMIFKNLRIWGLNMLQQLYERSTWFTTRRASATNHGGTISNNHQT